MGGGVTGGVYACLNKKFCKKRNNPGFLCLFLNLHLCKRSGEEGIQIYSLGARIPAFLFRRFFILAFILLNI